MLAPLSATRAATAAIAPGRSRWPSTVLGPPEPAIPRGSRLPAADAGTALPVSPPHIRGALLAGRASGASASGAGRDHRKPGEAFQGVVGLGDGGAGQGEAGGPAGQ